MRLAAIVESSDDAIIGKTLDGIIRSWNAGAVRLYGYSEKRRLGGSFQCYSGSHGRDPDLLEQIKAGEQINHYETARQRKEGRFITVSLRFPPSRMLVAGSWGFDDRPRHHRGKAAEETLRLASVYNRSLIEASIDPLVTI